MDRSSPAGDRKGRRGLAAVALAVVPVLLVGGVTLALAYRREGAALAARADAVAAAAAVAVDARLDVLRARLAVLAANPEIAGPDGASRLARVQAEEPVWDTLHRVAPDGTSLPAALPVPGQEGSALRLSAPLAGTSGEMLVATVTADTLAAPLAALVPAEDVAGGLPHGTHVRLVGDEPAAPASILAVFTERPIGAAGWRVRVEVPRATATAPILARLGLGLLGLAAAAAVGVAFGAVLLGRGKAPLEPAVAESEPLHGGEKHAMPTRALLHDLATSLTLAGAEARRLADGELGPLESPQAELARQLAARVEGMIRLVRAGLSEVGPGGYPWGAPATGGAGTAPGAVPRGPASLVALAEGGAEAIAPLAGARGITLDFEPPAPDGDPLIGYWDSDSLGRVIANLLDNAIKYTPAGGTVRITVSRDGRAALLSVRDTGSGLTPEELDAVFEPGRRGSAATRLGAPGLGLGLTTCRAIVTAHGGRIWLESGGVERGTVAHVRLPLDRRRAPRGHGRWPARVDWGTGREVEATVETISRSGAAVRLAVAPPVGALVALRIGGLPVEVAADAGGADPGEEEVAALGRVVRILEEGHPADGRPAGGPDPRAPLAAIAFAEVGPGTGARLERAVAAAGGARG